MPTRFTQDQLTDMALSALRDVSKRAETEAIKPTAELRFLFAYLAAGQEGRSTFDNLWKALTRTTDGSLVAEFGRRQTINSSVKRVHRLNGREP